MRHDVRSHDRTSSPPALPESAPAPGKWDASHAVDEVDGMTVTSTQHLPTWSGRAHATGGAQAEWDRFYAALAAHENEPLDVNQDDHGGYRGFNAIAAAVLGIQSDPAQKAFDASNGEVGHASASFDADTRYGATTGASLDMTKDPPRSRT